MNFAVRLRGDVHRGLSLPVELFQVETDAAIEAKYFGPNRLAGGVANADAREPELILERTVDEQIPDAVEHASQQRHFLAVENLLAPPAGQPQEEIEHLALDDAGIRHPDHGDGQQVLVNPRRRERVGRADLAPILND